MIKKNKTYATCPVCGTTVLHARMYKPGFQHHCPGNPRTRRESTSEETESTNPWAQPLGSNWISGHRPRSGGQHWATIGEGCYRRLPSTRSRW